MKFVFAAYGSRGDTEPCIAVAEELQRRGHEVVTAMTVPPELRAHVESRSLAVRPYGRHWQELLGDEDFTRMLRDPIGAMPQAVEYVAQVGAEKTATLTSLAAGADLLVAGMTEQETAAKVAEQQRIPWAALHFFPPEILPSGSSRDRNREPCLPGDEPSQSAQPLEIQAYDEICVPDLAASWAGSATRRPFVGALTLQLSTEADADIGSWIGSGAPPVYFGFGSMPVPGPKDMVAVIGAACERNDTRALICLGPNYFDGSLETDRVKIVRDVNHSAVFPACRAIVHHGGAGTTAAGLRAGVPALVLWNGLDQPVWAASVAHLETGFGRPFLESTLDSLVADLRAILAPRYAVRAREVAAQTTAPADSLRRTADLLEEAARPGGQD